MKFRTRSGGATAVGAAAFAVALGALLLAPIAGPAAPKKAVAAPPVQKKALLVFALDTAGVTAPNIAELGKTATEVAISRFQLTKTYMVTEFYKGYPPISRALTEADLSTADVTPPFVDDKRKAAKVVRVIGYDQAFVGAVADYQYNSAKKQTTVTVNGVLLEGTKDTVGYRVIKNSVGTGTAAVGAAGEEAAAVEAARTASDQLMTELFAKSVAEPAKGSNGK